MKLLLGLIIVCILLWIGASLVTLIDKKNTSVFRNWILTIAVFLSVWLTIHLFVSASGGFKWWIINPEYWAYFGSFIGAILLATTIYYQYYTYQEQKKITKEQFEEQKRHSEEHFRQTQIQSDFMN